MSTTTDQPRAADTGPPPGDRGGTAGDDRPKAGRGTSNLVRFLLGLVGLVVTVWVLVNLMYVLAGDTTFGEIPKAMQALLAIVGGVGGAAILFFFLNMTVEGFSRRWEDWFKPYIFLLPALGLTGLFLIYPAVQTLVYSFANEDSTAWVGIQNYQDVLGDSEFRTTLVNNLLWILIVPAFTVGFGLLVAVLADKLSERWEKVSKSMIFLPMAISFVGAATIWQFVYAFEPEGRSQIGLLNAIVTQFGVEPVLWLQTTTFNFNDMLLMVILIWLQTGFAMVLLSAAIKGVPEETLEAARIDGASEVQTFFQVVVPQIRTTMITVFITVLILVMKVFDIVYVMTNGNYDTNVIGLAFFQEVFIDRNNGVAAAIVAILMVAVIPVLIYQVRQFRAEEAR